MNQRTSILRPVLVSLCALLLLLSGTLVAAQQPAAPQNERPLTNQEFVKMLYQLPAQSQKRDELIEEIRRRGIGFELTNGLRGLVATKSGNDSLLRRTLEEAERRRLNPAAAARPSEAEAQEVLEQSRKITLAVKGGMPDFVVKQLITRSRALGQTKNWQRGDNLTVAVSYREQEGERYKLLRVNGQSVPPRDEQERSNYMQAGGTSSSGEFVSMLVELFAPKAQAVFKAVDTDTIRGRRALVYEYAVKRENSEQRLSVTDPVLPPESAVVGYRGRLWIDRETYRVLRNENISVEIPAGFPITATNNVIDYDWVTIAENKYLLPVSAEVELTTVTRDGQLFQTRNETRFRGYQKFGAEVKILDDDFVEEEPEKKP
ncbi:MAG: hypothetical protein ACRD9R_21080 [Pyrinomonadaceae bacterium]